MSITRKSQDGSRRRSCSAKMRRGVSRPIVVSITTEADYHRTPEQPRSPGADTTDTHTFAKHNSATRANFGHSTSACRIENKTEQKGAARFPSVQPFGPPNGVLPIVTSLALTTRWELAVDSGGVRLTWRSCRSYCASEQSKGRASLWRARTRCARNSQHNLPSCAAGNGTPAR